ncbi:MAG TPA: hypothetical protein DC000_09365 [Clostridiales bacterium]|nr:hypothetical protein [Clostridiales bacterium]
MKIGQFIELLSAECVTNQIDEEKEYNYAFASDLMSDVLALANNTTVLITGLNNPQVIRTAEMLDISLIILVRGKKPSEETLAIANETNITILTTDLIMFETCGKLYESGLSALSK